MSKKLTKDEIIDAKKASIRTLNNYLEGCINDSDPDIQKKAYLISSWLKQFVSYTSFEQKFDPTKNISYKRGNVVKVNFGFNVGCELGGPHYAIVLDKNNKHSADTLTVIPLISVKNNKKPYERDLLLGSELFNMLDSRVNTTLTELEERQRNCRILFESTRAILEDFKECGNIAPDKLANITNALNHVADEINSISEEIKNVKRWDNEVSLMREGSIARIEQITTVSKMRIWIPKNTSNVLYNISFSENTMKRINDKIKELYIF